MSAKEELQEILRNIHSKLQGLPQAAGLEQGAFFIIILFVAMLLFVTGLSCNHCCLDGQTSKHQATRVQII